MPQLNQPSNQIRLTNVSLVRLKKGKRRYEIACYKNKVLEWRSGVESDLDNVLQIPAVFISVSKGQAASAQELENSFGADTPLNDIILEILKKGELQVGEKERNAALERVHNEVISLVAAKLVDPRSKRVYTPGMIEKALDELSKLGANKEEEKEKTEEEKKEADKDAASEPQPEDSPAAKPKPKDLPSWTGVVTTRSAKSQALDAMKALIAHQPIPVARARMKVRVTCPTGLLKQSAKLLPAKGAQGEEEEARKGTVRERILGYVESVEAQEFLGEEWELVAFIEPGAFKGLGEFIGGDTRGRGRLEVLDMAVVHEAE
ncbi:MAG: hypothetical protein M1829_005338 [Trizodia sp. TS-e1964]|nr:MAG: hypothetical protein M1829_005338 [Trizodia sp. TS-e1964]